MTKKRWETMSFAELFEALDRFEERLAGGRDLPAFDEQMIEAGRIAVYEQCMSPWRACAATKDLQTGDIKVTPYGTWLDDKLIKKPDYMSKIDFHTYFQDRLTRDYGRERQAAIAKLDDPADDE